MSSFIPLLLCPETLLLTPGLKRSLSTEVKPVPVPVTVVGDVHGQVCFWGRMRHMLEHALFLRTRMFGSCSALADSRPQKVWEPAMGNFGKVPWPAHVFSIIFHIPLSRQVFDLLEMFRIGGPVRCPLRGPGVLAPVCVCEVCDCSRAGDCRPGGSSRKELFAGAAAKGQPRQV